MGIPMAEDGKMFIHSKCCNAHWELTWADGKYNLECEVCGKPAKPLRVVGPVAPESCGVCEGEDQNQGG